MKTRRIVSMIALAGILVGCQAFNDSNDEARFLGNIGTPLPDGSIGSGDGTVLCTPNANVVVSQNNAAAVADSTVGDAKGTTTVSSLDGSTVMVSVDGGTTTVAFGLTQSDKALTACNVTVKQGDDTMVVEKGVIEVGFLNKVSGAKTLNAGTFVLTVSPAEDASKAVKTLLGAKAEASKSTQIDGSYYADTVAPPAAAAE